MKQILLLISLCFSIELVGQNMTDSNGHRQGYWTFYEVDSFNTKYVESLERVIMEAFYDSTIDEKESKTMVDTSLKISGYYLDGKKTGEWIINEGKINGKERLLSKLNFKEDELLGEIYIVTYDYIYKGEILSNSDKQTLDCKPIHGKFWSKCSLTIDEIIEYSNLKSTYE